MTLAHRARARARANPGSAPAAGARTATPATRRERRSALRLGRPADLDGGGRDPIRNDWTDVNPARVELGVVQTMLGVSVGASLGTLVAFASDSPAAGLLTFAGAAIGYPAAALSGTDADIPIAHVQMMTSTWYWWMLNSALLAAAADQSDIDGLDELGAVLGGLNALAAMTAGHWVGLWLAKRYQPTSGQVALANSVGMWSGILVALSSMGWQEREGVGGFFGPEPPVLRTMLACNLGLALGASVGRDAGLSRAQVMAIDLMGGLGLATGVFLIDSNRDIDNEFGTLALATLGGLAVGAALVYVASGPPSGPSTALALPAIQPGPMVLPGGRVGLALGGRW